MSTNKRKLASNCLFIFFPFTFSATKQGRGVAQKNYLKFSHLVRRLDWRWEFSFSEAETAKLWIRDDVIFLKMPPLSLSEISEPLTLTHLSLFLFPHCKKNSGSEALGSLWFLSSVSISAIKIKKNNWKLKIWMPPYKTQKWKINLNS